MNCHDDICFLRLLHGSLASLRWWMQQQACRTDIGHWVAASAAKLKFLSIICSASRFPVSCFPVVWSLKCVLPKSLSTENRIPAGAAFTDGQHERDFMEDIAPSPDLRRVFEQFAE